MATTQRRKGVVIERDDLRILDTRELDWEEFPGLAGARQKVLARYPTGEPSVFLLWMPPGSPFADLPDRHYHASVREYCFVLGGDYPHWEYENADQQHGDCIVYREGIYMDRLPGSLHGIEEGPTSQTGMLILFWREGGTGNFIDEPNAGTETILVPYAPDRQPAEPRYLEADERGVLIERPDFRIVDTREMPWEPFPELELCRVKTLTRDADGAPMVFLLWFPPAELLPDIPHRHYHASTYEYSYVLSGKLPHWEYASAEEKEGQMVLFRQGFFMERLPGSIHGLEHGPVSRTGALMLSWRNRTGNFADEPDFDEETITVPY